MRTKRTRLIIDGSVTAALKSHVRLQFDDLRKAWVVLGPEHIYWPDDVSVAILQKLDGSCSVDAIIQKLAEDFSAPIDVIKPDVVEFLQTWADEQLICTRQVA